MSEVHIFLTHNCYLIVKRRTLHHIISHVLLCLSHQVLFFGCGCDLNCNENIVIILPGGCDAVSSMEMLPVCWFASSIVEPKDFVRNGWLVISGEKYCDNSFSELRDPCWIKLGGKNVKSNVKHEFLSSKVFHFPKYTFEKLCECIYLNYLTIFPKDHFEWMNSKQKWGSFCCILML